MEVTLNEAGLRALLETEEGPVGRHVEGLAVLVVAQAKANVRSYFSSAPMLAIESDVDYTMDGSSAIIGIREGGRKSLRLARAQASRSVNWLIDALDVVR